ncbi:prolyl oligopeptidase family serine peptidase [Arenibacter sp. GZD96]|uniref:CocE/NonD family hydrolase n=1 Tax=Aurantibrevibacter litoralis TaxID=3106030 RepID=UPI002AFDDEC5|nr:CocE/NonD family hydrolase [Arenibacter sp. GZD-96]MEA1787319.1 prolyl oligopeptidase family serine peptidase [Arenibacter sp. GZD-96]
MAQRIFLLFLLFQVHAGFSQTSLQKIALRNGSMDVGFRHYLSADSTRTYNRIFDWRTKSVARPIPISLWYPAKETINNTEPLKIIEYFEILKVEEEWEYLPNEQLLNWFYYPNTVANQNHLKEKTTAYKHNEPIYGRFPVVIYTPSYQASSIENFALCEFLASHGYIVISSPSRGTENRFFEGGTEKDLETQARDVEFLIKEVGKVQNADYNRIATMGFSFGGMANMLAQMRNKNIKAVISLDGSERYQYTTLKRSPFFNIEKIDIPYMHLAQKDIPELVLKEDNINAELNYEFELYDSIVYSDAFQLKFHNLTHSHFSTLGVLFEPRDQRQDKSDLEIMESYRLVSEYTLNFLNAFFKDDTGAVHFLENEPSENRVEKGLITKQFKKKKNLPMNFQDFNELALKQNYEHLYELYKSILEKNPTMQLPEGNLNNLGLQLVFNPKTSQKGINVFLFATGIYPNSANLFDSLAEAYLFMGDKEKAIENFKKSLKLDSQNQNAVDRLKLLEN